MAQMCSLDHVEVLVEPDPGTAENGAKTSFHNKRVKCRHCDFVFSAGSAIRVRAHILSEAGRGSRAAIGCRRRSRSAGKTRITEYVDLGIWL
jgi:hypothetical protein